MFAQLLRFPLYASHDGSAFMLLINPVAVVKAEYETIGLFRDSA